ncbi:MAG: type II toxin-antitoxin system Phd/YefM family antitoxin [Polaromonas sp.]
MSISIAQSRQQLSALISAAQMSPQIITKRNKTVAVLVSADYFTRTEAAAARPEDTFFNLLMQLRAEHAPPDDDGIPGADTSRPQAWSRANAFVGTD